MKNATKEWLEGYVAALRHDVKEAEKTLRRLKEELELATIALEDSERLADK